MSKNVPIAAPLVSIVVPAMNEELTIGDFVDACQEGLRKAKVQGEILIVDSSSDRTAEIAVKHGARIVPSPKRGLGQAYIDALPHIRGQYVIMGDCDLTYDFRELRPFIDQLEAGFEFVMGTRLKGTIEPGAMPWLHQYFGTPVTTSILDFIYDAKFSDIHCGMRAMTADALRKINLESSSWEYASEMVLKAARLKLKCTEIPINFYKDRAGRTSHHKRAGWFSPWHAGWINLKVMFVYFPNFFLKIPGLICTLIGLLLYGALLFGPLKIGPVEFSLHGMLLGIALVVVGYSSLQLGLLSEVIYDVSPQRTARYKRWISYNRGTLLGFAMQVAGLVLLADFIRVYAASGFRLQEISRLAITGLFLFTLVFQMVIIKSRPAIPPEEKR
jgi:glycosyltransferase involved in cell wall biosynthesis